MCSQQSASILIINVYLPTDYGTIESTTTFHETIAELEGFLLTQSYDYIIMPAGDFNVDFAKASRNCAILDTFMQTFELLRGDTSCDVLHSHTGGMTTSPPHGLIILSVLQLS